MSQEFEFPWKSNVVLGLCGLKTLRRRKKASGLKRERSKRSDPLETLKPLSDEEGSVLNGYWTKLNWPLAHASVKL